MDMRKYSGASWLKKEDVSDGPAAAADRRRQHWQIREAGCPVRDRRQALAQRDEQPRADGGLRPR